MSPTFRDSVSVAGSRVKMSVGLFRDAGNQPKACNNPEERRSYHLTHIDFNMK